MIDNGDCEAIGGIKIGRGNRCTRRKPALAPLLRLGNVFKRPIVREFTRIPEDPCKREMKHVERNK
jgi:hypothetical protein